MGYSDEPRLRPIAARLAFGLAERPVVMAPALEVERPGTPERLLPFSAQAADRQAAAYGALLASAIEDHRQGEWSVPAWTTAFRPGWRTTGSLGLSCEHDRCVFDLLLADWWHASACTMRNSCLVFCPLHGGPVRRWRGQPLLPLVKARRQLSTAQHPPPARDEASFYVYAFELEGLSRKAAYVGETAKRVEQRLLEHREAGKRAAKALRRQGVTMGRSGGDLLPDLPPLRTRAQSVAAQHWAHVRLLYLGYHVEGDGHS